MNDFNNSGLDIVEDILGEENEIDRLIFPYNVTESLAASGNLSGSEKLGIAMSFWGLGCFALGWFLAGWLRTITPEFYVWIVIAVELLLQLTVGSVILRFFLDERTSISEMSDDNNFSKYFGIYTEILQDKSPYSFDVVEFVDGSYAVYIQLLLGYNTNARSEATYNVNLEIKKALNKSGMPYKELYCNEHFSNSRAADELRDLVAGIEDPRLFKAYRDIVQGLLNIANEHSNVVCTTFVVYAKTRIQKDSLESLVRNVLRICDSTDTVYREVKVLTYPEIVELYRDYNKLDILDMGVIRAHIASANPENCPVKVLKIYGKSGASYSTNEFKKLNERIMKNFGLERVN